MKYVFGVASEKFLGYMVSQRGIEANLEKIKALVKMKSPRRPKDVQCLNERIAALSRFVSKATDKCLLFFKILKGVTNLNGLKSAKLCSRLLKSTSVNGSFAAREKEMASYLKLVKELIPCFNKFELVQISRVNNAIADVFSKLASSRDSELLKLVPIEHLTKPSIEALTKVMWNEGTHLYGFPRIFERSDLP
ncbi:RNase H domain-containing protein [Abeliophyllum distichum]|uniref:RNase H domain-containing protein n=1 Tax=Abeliophyllum distichum TaxID=126358 RepID=A0ABD1QIZ2_9LAMI